MPDSGKTIKSPGFWAEKCYLKAGGLYLPYYGLYLPEKIEAAGATGVKFVRPMDMNWWEYNEPNRRALGEYDSCI